MHAEIFDPRFEPVPAEWEKFVQDEGVSAAWSADALAAVAWTSQRTVHLGLVFDGKHVVALFCGDFGALRRRRARFSATARLPLAGVFFARILMGFDEGFVFAESLDLPGRTAARAAFERGLRARLGRRCLGIVYQNVATASLPAFRSRTRLCRPVSPNSVLVNRWGSMDEYFAGLPRRRRRRFEQIYRDVDRDPGLRVLRAVPAIDPHEASRLEQLTRLKHLGPGEVLVPLPSLYFERLNHRDGVRYFAHTQPDDGALVSFDLSFEHRGGLVTTVTGSASGARKGQGLYWDLYLREIEYVIDRGLPRLEFGKGLVDLKKQFGCVTETQYAVAAPW
ncbi:hypothetical protein [Actinoplanes awajinensis]|uniref:BioF2-like acetyltransferase domain-containing protein n=1 Tax=Actinoplanes awajinensis subsp. mycoplanecinus TaxID=135947 RepID=A0A0X3UPT4_9ACTN|nr:hypothetical protein [Actinoplanes awajinensis]KUL34524.1 hypothetical protein ADL15_15725 [Actinoplanes awajinensis subsp. mycoplanecinus]